MYWSDQYAVVRDYVDHQEAHCDDIALNFLVSNASGKQPHLFVMTPQPLRDFADYGRGLTSQTNRGDLRTVCLRWLIDYFGFRPPRVHEMSCAGDRVLVNDPPECYPLERPPEPPQQPQTPPCTFPVDFFGTCVVFLI